MSYMRIGYPNKYVDGESKDYIYSDGEQIVDYGCLDDSSIVEILCRFLDDYLQKDRLFYDYITKNLASRLDVKLRDKSLSTEEWFKLLKRNDVKVSDLKEK